MSILDKIVAQKRTEVARLPARPAALENLIWAVKTHGPRRAFRSALLHPRTGSLGLIAEIKKASPSAGVIRPNFDAVEIAMEYEAAGASCLSVLTDETFFQGSLGFLKAVRQATRIPLLRKDFIIHERQIHEAIEWGADAILLIVSILDDQQLRHFRELAEGAGLDALVEVHDEAELDRALASGATFVGVNNRDLRTFQVDLATSERLIQLALERAAGDRNLTFVAESGIRNHADVLRLQRAGAQAILVGESLMRESQITPKLVELMEG